MKTLRITGVRTIFNIARPIVVFEVAGHPAIVRNPKQALIDMQNGGLCLDINAADFANGIEGVNPYTKAKFQKALLRRKGGLIEGEFTVVKAGDKYIPNDSHPIFTDKNYAGFGTLKAGESLIADKDGVWVDGFCTISETDAELEREANAEAYANARVSMLGGFGAAPVAVAESLPSAESLDLPQDTTANEAFGKAEVEGTAKTAKASK